MSYWHGRDFHEKSTRVALSAGLAVIFITVLGVAVKERARALQAERLLANTYHHAFAELTTAARELDSALQKVTYTTPGPLRDSLYQQIYAKALAAQYALGELPYASIDLEQTAAFFAKTGDYAMSLSQVRERPREWEKTWPPSPRPQGSSAAP